MKAILFSFMAVLTAISIQAQTISIKVTENGTAMAYHNVKVFQNGSQIGSGQTDNSGNVRIETSGLYGKNIDVEGKYQSGGTKKEWSIKGKLKLDNSNSIHIKLEEIGKDINKDFGNFGKSNPTPNANASTIAKSDFQRSIKEIDGMMSSFDKAAKAKRMAVDLKMSSAQIKELLSKLPSSFDQKDVAIAAYQNCTDKKNFGIVTESFMSSITKRDVENATINKKD
jgi:hypothetical protein